MFMNQKGITLILSILILTAVLSIGLFINNLVLQQVKITRDVGFSEIAFYAAEAGMEKTLYEINQNTNPPKTSLTDLLAMGDQLPTSKGEWKVESIIPDNKIPDDDLNHFPENPGEEIDNLNYPLKVKINNTESFQLNLDLNLEGEVVDYPTDLEISWPGSDNTILVVYEWDRDDPITSGTQTTYLSSPVIISTNPISQKYHIIRINNLTLGPITYTLTPSEGTLPIGVLVTTRGRHPDAANYEKLHRKIEIDNARWQIY